MRWMQGRVAATILGLLLLAQAAAALARQTDGTAAPAQAPTQAQACGNPAPGPGDPALPPRISDETVQKILAIPKGSRPDPVSYVPADTMRAHLAQFAYGASFLTTQAGLDKFGRELLGRPDNSQFVMAKWGMDKVVASANGSTACLELALGLPAGAWKGQRIVRIDIAVPGALNLRMPSGNEGGANADWIPGGRLPSGHLESVVNQIPKGQYTESLLWP